MSSIYPNTLLVGFVAISAGVGLLSAADIAPGATIYPYYSYTLAHTDTSKRGQNEFGVSRAYLNIKAKLSPEDAPWLLKARVTYDVEPLTKLVSGDTSLHVKSAYVGFLKYAYAEVAPTILWLSGLSVRIGMIPTPWIGYEESLWRFRFVEKTYTDRIGILSSADIGASVDYTIPRNLGSLSLAYFNGEGYKSTETNEFKDVGGRFSLTPLGGAGLHIYYHKGTPSEGNLRDRLLIGLSESLDDKLGVMGQYLVFAKSGSVSAPTQASGYNAWLWLDLGHIIAKGSFGILGKYEFYDPHVDIPDDGTSYLLAGAYYTFSKGWQCSLNYRSLLYQDPSKEGSDATITANFLAEF